MSGLESNKAFCIRSHKTIQTLKNLLRDHNTLHLSSLASTLTLPWPHWLMYYLLNSKFPFCGFPTGRSLSCNILPLFPWLSTLLLLNLLKCHFLNEAYLTTLFKTCKTPYSLTFSILPFPIGCYFQIYISRFSTRG